MSILQLTRLHYTDVSRVSCETLPGKVFEIVFYASKRMSILLTKLYIWLLCVSLLELTRLSCHRPIAERNTTCDFRLSSHGNSAFFEVISQASK